ncbi:MAG TPA: hypothetical protein VEQ60_23895 [Longimicrobium sp.]|nr:hypothetical protein [Longimicrobium sp.]
MMSHRILSAALLLCTLAACGDLPTHGDTQAQPAGPAYDDGYTIGSGNSATASSGYTIGSGSVAADGGGFTIGSGNAGTQDGGYGIGSGNTATNTLSGDSTGRGGYGIGSGN